VTIDHIGVQKICPVGLRLLREQALNTATFSFFAAPFTLRRSAVKTTPGGIITALLAAAVAQGCAAAGPTVQLGPRPYYLVDQMRDGPLKTHLADCAANRRHFEPSDFSIGHRGAPLQFPEHTRESYIAAARMGAGVIECDVTFTQDRQLVCRHAQCDLHTTTNIVATPLAQKCDVPPVVDVEGNLANAAEIRCCASDITLAEFRTLDGKMDAADRSATTIDGYLGGTANWRTDLYAGGGRGTLMSHAESIELFRQLGVGMTPELKAPQVPMPFQGEYTQEQYAQQLIDEYVAAGVPPGRVWPQSFNYRDILYWKAHAPAFAEQLVLLEGRGNIDTSDPAAVAALDPSLPQLAADGVRIVAPPMQALLQLEDGNIVPSAYARAARQAGLDIIAWTAERSGQLSPGSGGSYYGTVADALYNDGDVYTVMEVLAQDVGIIALFSDWPATTTLYANCRPVATRPARAGLWYPAAPP
jgi:glycerophosphoryl diester phosphodiesterase